MHYEGVLTKMKTEAGRPITYQLAFPEGVLTVNELLDANVSIAFKKFECLNCHKPKKIFRQGFCYDCFYESAEVGDWVLRPELSQAHLDIEDRNLEYEKKVQLQPHIVYLALSSNVKVGVTRSSQVPTRWIDQGASSALQIMEVPNRYLAGITEVALKDHLSDKTNWRKMLKNEIADDNLEEVFEAIERYIPEETQEYLQLDNEPLELDYPVHRYPEKVKSLNLSKTPEYEGVLKGIKGQYLIFEDDTVFNVRNNEGLVVTLSVN